LDTKQCNASQQRRAQKTSAKIHVDLPICQSRTPFHALPEQL
jgi:hypothetical protein